MNPQDPEFAAWLAETIDGSLPDAELRRRFSEIENDPAAVAAYADQMRMHALLAWKHGGAADDAKQLSGNQSTLRRRRWLGVAAAAAVIAVATVGIVFLTSPQPASAAAALERMIAVAHRAGDRTYTLSVLEGSGEFLLINGMSASCEGAQLHLGRGGQFVYRCRLSDGTERITGSDGSTSWDIIGPAPVHLSDDPARFRHHLPGERGDFSLLDPAGQLALLRDGYDISLSNEKNGLRGLKAVKRSREFRGPREARVRFHESSGTIRELDLIGLPQARGGPSAVRLTLTSETAFPSGFFSHTAHHESGRPVESEPPGPAPR